MTSFENYLQKIHSLAFTSILDDALSDHFNNWLSQLDNEELLRSDMAPKTLLLFALSRYLFT